MAKKNTKNSNNSRAKEHNPFNLSQVIYTQKVLGEMFTDLDNSYIGVMCGGKSRTVRVKDFLDKKYWYRRNSCYITGNIIEPGKRRCQKNVRVLNDVYIDLDTNHDEHSRFVNPMQAYDEIIDIIREEHIPYPSMIVNTTRGLQLHWFLDCVSVNKNRVALWKKIENELCVKLSDFYPDFTVASDESRLLRMPYSINTKTGRMSEILEFNSERYSLRDLKIALFGNEPTKAQLDYIARIEQKLGVVFPDNYKDTKENASTTIKLNKAVLEQENSPVSEKQGELIGKICCLLGLKNPHSRTYETANKFIRKHMQAYRQACAGRNKNVQEKANTEVLERFVKEHSYNDHCRETLLFLYRLSQMHILGNEDKAWEKTAQLNSVYDCPFNERRLKTLTNSAVKYAYNDPDRWYGKNAIVRKVGDAISFYFTGPEKKQGRDRKKQKEYNSQYYKQKREKENKESRAEVIRKRREQVRELLNRGLSYDAISKELGVCKKTIQRDVESLRKNTDVDIFSSTPLLYNTVGIQESSAVSESDTPATAQPIISSTADTTPIRPDFTDDGLDAVHTKAHLVGAFDIVRNKLAKCKDFTKDDYDRFVDGLTLLMSTYEHVDVLDHKLILDELNGRRKSAPVDSMGEMLIFLAMQNIRVLRSLVFSVLLWLRDCSTLYDMYLAFTVVLKQAMGQAQEEGGLLYY